MKLASKFSVFAMGLAIATATHPASAMPMLPMPGSTVECPAITGLDSTLLGCRFNQVNAIQAIESDGQWASLQESEAAEEMIAALIGPPMGNLDGVAAIGSDIDSLVATLLGEEVGFSDAVAELAEAEVTDGITTDTTSLISSSGGGGAFYGGAHGMMGGHAIIAGGHASHFSNHSTGIITPQIVTPQIVTPHVFPAPAPKFDGEVISGDTGASTPLPSGVWAGMVLLGALGTAHKVRSSRKELA